MIPFTYLEPASIDEALEALERYGEEAKLIAGGTGLVNLMKQQLVQPAYLIGLRRLDSLAGIKKDNEGLRIGALSTLRTIEESGPVREHANLLAETCRRVATIRIRSMATIGGAVAHADPFQDTPPALIALGARIRLRSSKGTREVTADEFFTGFYETAARADEMVTEVVIPAQPNGSSGVFLKFLPQTHDDYATVNVAARVAMANGHLTDVRVALGAAGSTPIRARAVEDALRGREPAAAALRQAASLVAEAVDPIPDFRGSADYKRDMAVVFTRRALEQAVTRAAASGVRV